jgi:hypothetical protein
MATWVRSSVTLGDETMSDLEIAVAFGHILLFGSDIQGAMQYATPDVTIRFPESTPYRTYTGAAGLGRMFDDFGRACRITGDTATEYYRARRNLIIGRISQSVVMRATGEPLSLDRTEWITIEVGLVSDIEVSYAQEGPVVRAAELAAV